MPREFKSGVYDHNSQTGIFQGNPSRARQPQIKQFLANRPGCEGQSDMSTSESMAIGRMRFMLHILTTGYAILLLNESRKGL